MSPLQKTPGSIKQPVYYLSHGGGPWPFMTGTFRTMFQPLEQSLQAIPAVLPATPRAVLIVSAHWETEQFMLSAADWPAMIYDYTGFPADLYNISYPAPGAPALAEAIAQQLHGEGWRVGLDRERGFDHGTYSLLKAIYPHADVLVVQMSIRSPLDPAEHLAMGQALQPLRDAGVLILGSGQSFHNLECRGATARSASVAFDTWLRKVLLTNTPEARNQALLAWESAPFARLAHPHPDHFIPLLVVAGAAGHDVAQCVFGDYLGDFATSCYGFGGGAEVSPHDVLRLHQQEGSKHERL